MKLTVVLLTYNRLEYLGLTIDSILNQTFSEFEFYIFDNGSDVATKDLVSKYKDSRIKYVRNDINSPEFLNTAFNVGEGKYLLITHDDDILEPDFIEREVKVLDDDDKILMVSTNLRQIDSKGLLIKDKTFDIAEDINWGKGEYINYYCRNGNIIACPTVMFRYDLIKFYKLNFRHIVGPMADLYLNFEVNLLNHHIYFIKDPLYRYRVHENQFSFKNRISMEIQVRPFVFDLITNSDKKNLLNNYKNASAAQILHLLIFQLFTKNISTKEFKYYYNQIQGSFDLVNKYLFFWVVKALARSIKKNIFS